MRNILTQRVLFPRMMAMLLVGVLAVPLVGAPPPKREQAPGNAPAAAKNKNTPVAKDGPAAKDAPAAPRNGRAKGAGPAAGRNAPAAAEAPAEAPAEGEPADGPEIDPAIGALANAALAERLCEMAQNRLRAPVVTEPMWRQSAALLQAARELNPSDPRFPRLQLDVALKTNNLELAIEALNAYRKLMPQDRVAQIQLIDLHVARMETADAKLAYLAGNDKRAGLVQKETLPPEVRAHAGVLAASLLLERAKPQALQMIDRALELNPLSPPALRMKYGLLVKDAKPPERVEMLLAMLRSNPTQAWAMTELADLLAGLGMSEASLEWYNQAMSLYPRSRQEHPPGFIADYATQLFRAGQDDAAANLLSQYLKARPLDADAWFVKLAVEKTRGRKQDKTAVDSARRALVRRWIYIDDKIAGRAPEEEGTDAAEAPADEPLTAPDPEAALAKLKAGEAEELKDAFAAVMGDLAWFELYFGNQPDAAAKWAAALGEVLDAESVTLARLRGWLQMAQGDTKAARATLKEVEEEDPLAALGLLRLAGKPRKTAADASAVKLLEANRMGVVGAIVWSELKAGGATMPGPAEEIAGKLTPQLEKFPKALLGLAGEPHSFYIVRAEPLKVAHKYREPIFVRVSVQNVSQFDLTIGGDGAIRPDLWFDAQLGGLANKGFSGIVYDRIAQHVVLKPGESTLQFIRFDQGMLQQALMANPGASVQMTGLVTTNPISTDNGIAPGPGGQRVKFTSLVVRQGFPISSDRARERAFKSLQAGDPREKMATIDLFAAYIRLIVGAPQADEATRNLANRFYGAISQARGERLVVSSWAHYQLAQLSNPEDQAATISLMAADTYWHTRLLALRAAEALPAEDQLDLAGGLAERDPNPIVKAYAVAMVDLLKNPPPTTQPTTPEGGAEPAGGAVPAPSEPGASPAPEGSEAASPAEESQGPDNEPAADPARDASPPSAPSIESNR